MFSDAKPASGLNTVKMDIFGERTLCLLSPAISSITASTFLPGSTSRGSRSRTRMGTSMERNFYTFILFSLALVILILSPSASANQRACTPMFTLLSNGGEGMESDEYGSGGISELGETKTQVTVREEASYKLTCLLNRYNYIKWTINGREVTPQLKDKWNIDIQRGEEMEGYHFTELRVNNATQMYHAGEYKCASQCSSSSPTSGANVGFTVRISIAINVTIADSKMGLDPHGVSIYRRYVAKEKQIDLTCKAPVPNAQMTWIRLKDDKRTEEPMDTVCGVPDVELAHRKKKTPHCEVKRDPGNNDSSITLKFYRVRKEGQQKLDTISDFRRYICRAIKEGNQDGHAYVDLLERVSTDRKFDRGHRSVTATEGEKLEIYCDVYGVDQKEFISGDTKLNWKKNGEPLGQDDLKDTKKMAEFPIDEKGNPTGAYRVGFKYDMAEPVHKGQYTCQVQRGFSLDAEIINGTQTEVTFTYKVRVKDKLGALWPFLGICGEVVILCTIILIYEKRRNKQELEESDTDGSPDQ